MPTPIQIQILDEAESRLSNISEVNEYSTTQIKIERARLTPFNSDDIPALNIWLGPDLKTGDGGGFTTRSLELVVEYHSKTRDRPFIDVAMELAADVIIALDRAIGAPTVSDQPSTRLGGLVAGIDVTSIIPAIGEGQAPWCGVMVTFKIEYGVRPSDPFVLVT